MSYEEKDTCHTAAGKGRDFPVVINAPNSNDVEIVCRIVECAPQGPVVTNGGNDYNIVR